MIRPGPQTQARALALLEEGAELSPTARVALFEAAARENPRLGPYLAALDEADANASGALPTNPAMAESAAPPAPERIGPYRITGEIGRGGMGVVLRGERCDGLFEHAVAIKLVRPGLFAGAAQALFEEERRILARLTHPAIARLYDGGETPDGLSYVVMELLEGEPLLEWAQGRTLDERLQAFLALCGAVAHAHAQLIVHADIKPGNVLVTRDGPKLMDFGIARFLSQDAQPVLGPITAAYASPQRMAGEPARPADDIFALGRVLSDLVGASQDRDLNAILAMATAARAEGRYGSVDALAEDVRRRLELFPVRARGGDWRYHAKRFLQRRRGVVLAVAGVVIALTAGATIATVNYLRAEAARKDAAARFDQVRGLANFLIYDVADAIAVAPGTDPVRDRVVSEANAYLSALSAIPDPPPALALEIARGETRVGMLAAQAGRYDLARARLEQTGRRLAALAGAAGLPPGELALAQTEHASARFHMAALSFDPVRSSPFLAEAEGALARARAAASAFPDDERMATAEVMLTTRVVLLLQGAGRFGEAVDLLDRLLARPPAPPAGQSWRRLDAVLLLAQVQRAGSLRFAGRTREAIAAFRATLAALETRTARIGSDREMLFFTAATAIDLATALFEEQAPQVALAEIERAEAALETILRFGRDHEAERQLAVARIRKARALSDLGRASEARTIAQAVLAQRQAAAARDQTTERARDVALTYRTLGEIEARAGQTALACALARGAGGLGRAGRAKRPPGPRQRPRRPSGLPARGGEGLSVGVDRAHPLRERLASSSGA